MPKINLETAEKAPFRLSHNTKKEGDGKQHPYHKFENCNWVRRFIGSYIGKPYDKLYSDFLAKLRSDRKYKDKSGFNCMMVWFDHSFNTEFVVDNGGNVRKNKKMFHLNKTYTYRYKFILDSSYYHSFIYYLGEDTLNNVLEGLTYNDYIDLIRSYKFYCFLGTNCRKGKNSLPKDITGPDCFREEKIYKKTEDKNIKAKRHYEAKRHQRKLERVAKEKNKAINEIILTRRLKDQKDAEKALEISKRELEKMEKIENEVTRDRMGFDDTSFKEPQKFKRN